MSLPQRKNPVNRVGPRLVGLPPDQEPATPAPVAEAPPTPVPLPYRTTVDILYGTEQESGVLTGARRVQETQEQKEERKKKDAERKRNERKRKADQKANWKKALREMPAAEFKRLAEEKKREEEFINNPDAGMSRGDSMPGAPHGKGRLVTGGHGSVEVESVAAASARAEILGAPTDDAETDESFWPEHDRKHIKPEGSGPGDAASATRFKVRGTDKNTDEGFDIEWGQALQDLFRRVFVEIQATSERGSYFICRLCHAEELSEMGCKGHLEKDHGDDDPDERFGNVIRSQIRENKRRAGADGVSH